MKNALRIKTLTTLFLIFALLSGFSFTNVTRAQENEGLSLTLSPNLLDIRATPGEIVEDKVKIYNNLSNKVVIVPQIYALKVEGESGGAVPKEEITAADEHISWFRYDVPEVVANSNEWVDVPFRIEIPDDAAFGYYYALTFAPKDEPNIQTNGAQTTLSARASVFLLLNVEKNGAIADLSLLDFSAERTIFEYLPANFRVRVENLGNVHLRPKGDVFIRRPGSKEDLAIIRVNETNGNVLPGTKRVFELSWNDGFIIKDKESGNLKFNWDKLLIFRFGPYEARLLLVFFDGSRDIPIEKTVTFYIIPYTAIGIGVLLIFALFLGGRWLLRKYVQKQVRKFTDTDQTNKKNLRIK
jgi:hypothetical protein